MLASQASDLCERNRQHPVRTAAWSLWWRVATEQIGVGFVHLDELDEIVDAGACEGRYRLSMANS